MSGQISVKCDKCGFTTNLPYLVKPNEFIRGGGIMECYLIHGATMDIAKDGKWWLYDEHGEGIQGADSIVELVSIFGERDKEI